MPNAMENHNPKVRRRNVIDELLPLTRGTTEISDDTKESGTTSLDSFGAWHNGRVPRIPLISHPDTPTKTNGSLVNDKESDSYFNDDHSSSFDDVNKDENGKNMSNRKTLKIGLICKSVEKKDLTFGELKVLGCSDQGLVNDDIRRVLWPRLLRLEDEEEEENVDSEEKVDLETIHTLVPDDVYQQILKDVARSGGHLTANASEDELDKFRKELSQLICWVLHRHPRLNYYQGYNDIAATVLLVMGLQRSLNVLEQISLNFLERFMERTMERVNQELFYIYALLERVHPKLLEHLENVELFPHFALAEYTTWYAHKYAENRKLLHRLFDFFLGSPPLMPLYLSTIIVAHRATEIFNTTPDMGHTHKVLCTLPDDLPFESLLIDAKELYREYPPDSISNDVREYDHKRRCKELEWRAKAEAGRRERERLQQLKVAIPQKPMIPYRFRNYRTITVVTILAIGIYAFLKSNTAIN